MKYIPYIQLLKISYAMYMFCVHFSRYSGMTRSGKMLHRCNQLEKLQ